MRAGRLRVAREIPDLLVDVVAVPQSVLRGAGEEEHPVPGTVWPGKRHALYLEGSNFVSDVGRTGECSRLAFQIRPKPTWMESKAATISRALEINAGSGVLFPPMEN